MKRYISSMMVLCLFAPSIALAEQGVAVQRTPAYWYSYAEKLPIGSTVRIRTTDGKRHTAVLSLVDPDGITVEMKTRVPEPARRFPYDQIQQLEPKANNGPSLAKAAAVGAAIGAGTFLTILALFAATWD
jgi:hypothetical protein